MTTKRVKDFADDIFRLHKLKLVDREIAEQLGFCTQTIWQFRQENNLGCNGLSFKNRSVVDKSRRTVTYGGTKPTRQMNACRPVIEHSYTENGVPVVVYKKAYAWGANPQKNCPNTVGGLV